MKLTGDTKERKLFYPIAEKVPLIEHDFYTSAFSPVDNIPVWVAYRRTPGREIKTVYRNGEPMNLQAMLWGFHIDPKYPLSPNGSDYGGSGFDCGHCCPAESMRFERDALAQTFYTTNAMPQLPALNRGPWKTVENKESEMAAGGATLEILTGPVFHGIKPRFTESGIAIPDLCWKIVACPATKKIIAFIIPNSEHVDSDIRLHTINPAKLFSLLNMTFPAWADFDFDENFFQKTLKFRIENPNRVLIENLMNGEYILLANYIWNPWDARYPNARILIPKGFTTDFGSVPKLAQNVYPPIGTFRDKDFLGHDWLYGTEYFQWEEVAYKYVLNKSDNRAECDMRFLESLKGNGDNWISRNTIWSAVKLGGGAVWKQHTLASILANRKLLTGGVE
jgi:endonuclease G